MQIEILTSSIQRLKIVGETPSLVKGLNVFLFLCHVMKDGPT